MTSIIDHHRLHGVTGGGATLEEVGVNAGIGASIYGVFAAALKRFGPPILPPKRLWVGSMTALGALAGGAARPLRRTER